MLGIMRKYKQSIIIKAVFVIIVLSFIGTIFLIWGEGGEGLKGSGYALKVNGEKIPYDEYLRNYKYAKESLQQIYGQTVTPEIEKQLHLRENVIENMINKVLVRQNAKESGIKITDTEVVEAIAKIPYFQKDGKFDKKRYEQVLQQNRIVPGDFEQGIREDLLISKAGEKVIDKVTLSEKDLLQYYKKMNDKIDLQFVSFSPGEVLKDVTATDKELTAYIREHESVFKTKEEISLAYVLLSPAKLLPKLTVSNEEMQSYYQRNIDRYQGEEGILPLEAVKEQVKKDALAFKAMKQAYESVALAMNKHISDNDLNAAARSLELSITKTALFTLQAPPEAIEDETGLIKKAFATKEGVLGGPVETSQGVYLFKVTARKPSVVPPLAKIRGEVEKRVLAKKAFEQTRKMAQETLDKMRENKYAKNLRATGFFSYSKQGEIPKIGISRETMDAAITLTSTSPVAEKPFLINGRWYAIRLEKRTDADITGFEKEKENIRGTLLPEKQREAQEAWLKDLRSKAKIVINPALEME